MHLSHLTRWSVGDGILPVTSGSTQKPRIGHLSEKLRIQAPPCGSVGREHPVPWYSNISIPFAILGEWQIEPPSSIISVTARCPHSAADPQLLAKDFHQSGALPRACWGLPEYEKHPSPAMSDPWRNGRHDSFLHSYRRRNGNYFLGRVDVLIANA